MNQQQALQLFEYCDGRLHHRVASRGRKVGDAVGCINGTGYRRVGMHGQYYTEHSLVFLMFHGYVPSEIDHINGNRADNRIENLREVSRSQNQYNKAPQKNTSGVRNVSWHKKSKAWIVRLTMKSKIVFCQYFKDFELAELVALEAREKFFGKFNYQGY